MTWLDEYVDCLFDREDTPELAEFADEHGIELVDIKRIENSVLYEAVMRRFKHEAIETIAKLSKVLLEKAIRGDVPAMRLIFMTAKPDIVRGKIDDPMETYREL